MHYAVNSTTDNANYIHQVAYGCESAVKLPTDSNSQFQELGSLVHYLNHLATEAYCGMYISVARKSSGLIGKRYNEMKMKCFAYYSVTLPN